jgi:DNA-binding transcriptional LysR family regulator
LVAPLAERIIKVAPRVTLEFRPSGTLNIPDLLDRGQLDLAIGPLSEQGERFSHQELLQDEFVAVLRKDHPAARSRQLSLENISTLSHLEISSVQYATDFIDEALARRKLTRWIALRAPSLSAVQILASSDMIAVFPQRIADVLIHSRPLVIRPLSHSSHVIKIAMIWPRRLINQAAHRWLREIVGLVTEDLHSE